LGEFSDIVDGHINLIKSISSKILENLTKI
jgi:hypothetical protein